MAMRRVMAAVMAVLLAAPAWAGKEDTFVPSDGTGDKIRLRMRLAEGKTYRLRFVTDQTIEQAVMGQQQKVSQTMGFDYSFKVTRVAADG